MGCQVVALLPTHFPQFFLFANFVFIGILLHLHDSHQLQQQTMGAEKLSVSKAFAANNIVPDVVSQAPEKLLTAEFNGGVYAELGNELVPNELTKAPHLTWEADKSKRYTVAMVDPDAPSRREPTNREWLHWLVVNVPGTDVGHGERVINYMGPTPPKGTGLHRYVFLVYEQQPGAMVNVTQKPGRSHFDIREFAEELCVGPPLAGNFFNAQYHN